MKIIDLVILLLVFYFGFFVKEIFSKHNSIEIHALDVGQGDSILIDIFGSYILIDGGGNYELDSKINKYIPFWNCQFSAIYLTHPHADHLMGLNRILQRCKTDLLMFNDVGYNSRIYDEFKELGKKFNVLNTYKGELFFIEGAQLITFWPQKDLSQAAVNVNNISTVVLLDYKNFEALFLGDLEEDFQSKLNIQDMKIFIDGDLEVVKIAHHGAINGLNKKILTELKPEYCIISVGKDNKFGHPSEETTEFLKDIRCKTLRTDEVGDVDITLITR